jgi:hypothetical protein
MSRFRLSIGGGPGVGTGFAPLKTPSQTSRRTSSKGRRFASHNVPPGFACAVHSDNPRNTSYSSSQGIDYHINGKSYNSCLYGVGVSRMEISSWLQRFESNAWVSKASAGNYAWMPGGDIYADADFNCNHADLRYYKTVGFAWSTVNGVGQGAASESSAISKTCPDSH